jgi:gas vesicle protein
MAEKSNSFKKNMGQTGKALLDEIKNSVENSVENNTEKINSIENNVDNTADIYVNMYTETAQDLLNEVLKSKKKVKSYPHTIYLTEETGNALVKYARRANKSKSGFLEELLHRILLNGSKLI